MLLKFYTPSCQPCKALSAVLDEKRVDYVEVNVNEYVDRAIANRIRSVPVLINDETGARLDGFKDKAQVEAWLNDHYY